MSVTQISLLSRPLMAGLAILTAVVYLLTASRADMNDANNDVASAAIGAWTIAQSGQPWLDDAAGRRSDSIPDRAWVAINVDNGRAVISRSPGVIAAVVPASWVAQRLGMSQFGPGPQLVTAALLTTLAMTMMLLALRRTLDPATVLLVTAGLAFATPVWSVNANGMWPHVLTVLGVAGMSWAAAVERWWLVGLFGGIAIWGRLHTALIVAVIGIGLALMRRRPDIALKCGLVSGIAMGLASLWSWWHYSSWVPSGGYGGSAAFRVVDGSADIGATEGIIPNQLGMWVSPGSGILVWTPVLVLALPNVVRHWRRIPDWARLLLIAGLIYTVVQAQLNTFTGGSGYYGYRHGLEFVACATPAIAHSLSGVGSIWRRAAVILLSLQFGVIALGATFDGAFIAPDRAWRTNAFVEVLLKAPVTGGLVLLLAAAALTVGAMMARCVTKSAEGVGPKTGVAA